MGYVIILIWVIDTAMGEWLNKNMEKVFSVITEIKDLMEIRFGAQKECPESTRVDSELRENMRSQFLQLKKKGLSIRIITL